MASRDCCALRAGATVSEAVRAQGLRHCRYRGLAKTHVQHVLTAAGTNRIDVDGREGLCSNSSALRPPTDSQDHQQHPKCGPEPEPVFTRRRQVVEPSSSCPV
ncbi:transposase [Saccharothrix stipae]